MAIPMFLILLFSTALINIFLYLRTANDIFGVLAVGMTICCLIWGLVIAHWSIHLLTLLILLYYGKSRAIATATVSSKAR